MNDSNQTLFDRAVRSILKQQASCIADGSCQYIDECGNRCAIGWLLSESVCRTLEADYPGTSVNQLKDLIPDYNILGLGDISEEDLEFLQHLQRVHDDPILEESDFIYHFKQRAAVFAERYSLDTSVLNE